MEEYEKLLTSEEFDSNLQTKQENVKKSYKKQYKSKSYTNSNKTLT